MPGQGNLTAHCPDCQILRELCVCAEARATRERITELARGLARPSTCVVILMHWRETHLTTNTARLVAAALPGCELRLRGKPGVPQVTREELGPHPVLLYPSPDAVALTPEVARALPRPLTLVVPDGSWRQARKVSYREPAVAGIPCVKLPPGPPSEYRLRREPTPESVCTFEAVTRALGQLDGAEVERALEALFRTRVERTLWSRGWLKEHECTTEIPFAARELFRLSGYPKEAPNASTNAQDAF